MATRPAGETEDAQIDTQTAQPERVGVAREQGRFRLGCWSPGLEPRTRQLMGRGESKE